MSCDSLEFGGRVSEERGKKRGNQNSMGKKMILVAVTGSWTAKRAAWGMNAAHFV